VAATIGHIPSATRSRGLTLLRFALRREGMFNLGSGTDGGKVEAFIKGDWLWYRLNVPYTSDPVAGILVRRGDTYSGEVAVKTAACDWQIVAISATLAH
jgi:hypothetical protein